MNKVTINTLTPKMPVTESLYGLFFEDINRSGDGGLYPEMLRNRTFEDSIIPADCVAADDKDDFFLTVNGWKGDFTHGEGLARWPEANKTPYTPIPAWYAENAQIALDDTDVLNAKRLVSLKATFADNGCVYNIGYMGVPAKAGSAMTFYMFAKADAEAPVTVAIEGECGCVYASKTFAVGSNGYIRYDATLVPMTDDKSARFVLRAPEGTVLHLGFASLMPADTYNGHGLRTDLVEKLAALKPAFMRFPGGCIVEGFNKASLLRFSNMIGPMWERPTNWNLWAYRTTNGLGYHEWLQLCEDLHMKKMWVFNCGLTCQGRKPEFFTGEDFDVLLQEAIDAIEYATAPVGTKFGDMRAAAGHPEPFGMDYVEIGNENWGPEYNSRYARCYEVLKEKYPQITYISNTHTERDGLPTDIADEHYYNTPEFFAEAGHKYDNYPRKDVGAPEIFVGEYAVTAGQPGTLRAALGEAIFLMGMERNQDIVTLASYAPLFENVSFYNWYPNLICFDNSTSYGIPSWHMLKLMGANRGKFLADSTIETLYRFKERKGIFSVGTTATFSYKNVTIDGVAAPVSHELLGSVTEKDGVFTTVKAESFDTAMLHGLEESLKPQNWTRMAFGEEPKEESTLEVSVNFVADLNLQALVNKQAFFDEDDGFGWSLTNARGYDWKMEGGKSWVEEHRIFDRVEMTDMIDFTPAPGWHDFKIVTHIGSFDCYMDGELIHHVDLPSYPTIDAVADVNGDEVIVKIVNFTDVRQNVQLALDCEIQSAYEVQCLTGDALAGNSIEDPENISVVTSACEGASSDFIYEAPAWSLSVLKLKK